MPFIATLVTLGAASGMSLVLTKGAPIMGGATAINFQPTGAGKAAITGDFVLAGDEVNPVIKALRGNGIEVTAIHSHMLDEQPRRRRELYSEQRVPQYR